MLAAGQLGHGVPAANGRRPLPKAVAAGDLMPAGGRRCWEAIVKDYTGRTPGAGADHRYHRPERRPPPGERHDS